MAPFLIVGGATLVAGVVLVAARRKAPEPEAETLDLGMAEAPEAEAVAGAGERPGFVFGVSRARRPVHWAALLRIGFIVAVVASALAAALYYLGVLVKVQLDRVLGS